MQVRLDSDRHVTGALDALLRAGRAGPCVSIY